MPEQSDVDVVVVGAGFAGLYAVYRLRGLGFTVRAFEAGDDVGGTWYWNRYPGARVDIPSVDYMYSFDPDWRDGWQWSEKYATQPEILGYLNHVADKFDLRRDIEFGTRVEQARFQDATSVWQVRTDGGEEVSCRFVVMATGCLSIPKEPDIEGVDQFAGELYFTHRWPHDGVDFTGKRVAVIGTGSSGIQSIPLIAEQASQTGGLPAHPVLLDAGEQRADAGGATCPAGRRGGGLSRRRATVPRRRSDGAQHHPDLLGVRRPNADSSSNTSGRQANYWKCSTSTPMC